MSRFVDSSDRKLLIAAAALLIALAGVAALFAPSRVSGTVAIPSSYSPAWDGAEGAYLLLQKLGYRVERWEQPASGLPVDGRGSLLVLANPMEAPTGDDRGAIRTFLENGGRVLATGSTAADFLPESVSFNEGAAWAEPHEFTAQIPSPLTRSAPQISLLPAEKWEPKAASLVVLYADADGTPGAVAFPFGRGLVIWWAAPTPLTNGAIRRADNLAFVLDSFGGPGEYRILWDEYYHGVRPSLWSYFERTPLPWILAQFGLLFLAVLFTFSRRLGPTRLPAAASRLSPLEFVETLGDLYQTAHAGPAAVSIAFDRLHFLLTRRLALPSGASLAELSRSAAERFGWERQPLLDALSSADRARRSLALDDKSALHLVREIHHYIARLRPGPRKGNPS